MWERQSPAQLRPGCSWSQNDKGAEAVGPLDPFAQPLLGQGHPEQISSNPGIGGDLHGGDATAPGQPVPVLCHPHSTSLLPAVEMESPMFQLVPLPLVLALGTTEMSLAPFSLHPPSAMCGH